MRLFQELDFDAAHRLFGYDGSCNMLHGHRWCVKVTIDTLRELNTCGMIIDYRVIKQYFKDAFDHKCILNKMDPLGPDIEKHNCIVVYMDNNPTAENLARKIYNDLYKLFNLKDDDYMLIRIYESPENFAEEDGSNNDR